ncbi:unnamed protein product [Closterium sp. NIES-54]
MATTTVLRQRQPGVQESLSPPQLLKWAIWWGSPGAEPEEALHTFTLDSSASRCFFRDSTLVTPLTVPHPVTLANPSEGPVRYLRRLRSVRLASVVSSRTRLSSGTIVLATPPCNAFVACTPVSLSLGFPGPCPRSRARVLGQGGERYFLLVVDDYTRYTTVFPLQIKVEVCSVLIRWIRAVHRQLGARFQQDLPVLRLHSDRGGEFSSGLLEDICRAEGIRQTFTPPASPQQNGIAERRIGLVMEVARTSIVHACESTTTLLDFTCLILLYYALSSLALYHLARFCLIS